MWHWVALSFGAGLLLTQKNPVGMAGRPTARTVSALPQTNKNPSSAQAPRINQGAQANQPWYTGEIPQGGSVTASQIVAGTQALGSLFTTVTDFFGSGQDASDQGVPTAGMESAPDTSLDANTDSESYDVDPSAGMDDWTGESA